MAGKRILIVDDDAMVRESIEIILKLDGHVLENVDSAAGALERYTPAKYDVVLTDNRMPGMSGVELAKEIKTRNPSQRIILFSGSPPMQGSSVCDLILLKPFSAAQLRKAVANLANGSDPMPVSSKTA
jgi:CheY-like chemotaxis protein